MDGTIFDRIHGSGTQAIFLIRDVICSSIFVEGAKFTVNTMQIGVAIVVGFISLSSLSDKVRKFVIPVLFSHEEIGCAS